MTRRRRPSTTPYGRGPPPHGFAAGRINRPLPTPKRTRADRELANQARPVSTSGRSEEHTSEFQSLMRISYAVFCLKKKIYPIYIKAIPPLTTICYKHQNTHATSATQLTMSQV